MPSVRDYHTLCMWQGNTLRMVAVKYIYRGKSQGLLQHLHVALKHMYIGI